MDAKDINERLDKLENKMKMNFFEIEKRLVNLESKPDVKENNSLEKLNQLHDMVLNVQLENEKLKEMVMSSQEMYKNLSQKIENIEKSHPVKGGQNMDLDEIRQQIAELRERISRIEQMLSHKGKGILGEIHNILHG